MLQGTGLVTQEGVRAEVVPCQGSGEEEGELTEDSFPSPASGGEAHTCHLGETEEGTGKGGSYCRRDGSVKSQFLPCACCAALGKSLYLSGPPFNCQ